MKNKFLPPEHINAKTHKKIMKFLKNISLKEFFQSLIKLGVYTKEGKLTEEYEDEKK